MRKKIIPLIIGAAVILQSALGLAVYAENAGASAAEAVQVSEERAEMLRSLGVLYDLADDETEDLTKEVSRAEYAKILVKYFNKPYSCATLTQKPYIDVELTNEYARDIKTIKDLGYVADTETQSFRPQDTVTLNEAAAMLMRGLGYTYLSDEKELSAATELRVFSGISKNRSEGATLDNIYAMLENTLNAGIVETEWKNGSISYKSSDEKTVLSEYYEIKKMRGVVTANDLTGLSEASKAAGEAQIEIDGKVYGLKYKKCGDYLGYVVDFYLKSKESEDVIYAVPNNKNNVTEISSEELYNADNTQIYYRRQKKDNKTLKLEENYDVIYNKKAYSGYGQLKNILPEEGSITAIDNDNNGRADVLLITSYEFYMISDIYARDKKVYTTDGNYTIDLNEDRLNVEIRNTDGNTVNFAAVKKNCVLTVSESRNTDGEKMVSVIISDKKTDGTLRSKGDDTVTIDTTEYPATKAFLENTAVGSEGTFYFTHNGKAAFYKALGDNAWNIGMIYKMYIDENNDDQLYFSMYTPQNEFKRYASAKNVNIGKTAQLPNGARGWDAVRSALTRGELIRYILNDDGEIVKIEKADEGNQYTGERTYINEQGLRVLGEASSSFYYRNGIFDGRIVTDSDTLFFVIPPEGNWEDEDAFYTSASSVLKTNVYEYSYPYKAYAYDDGEVAYANVVVLSDVVVGTSNINTEANLFVIDSINRVVRDEDEIYNQLIMYGKGEKNVYYCSDSILNEYDLQKCDVIQFEADSSKKIRAVRKILNADSQSSVSPVLIPGTKHSNGTTPTKDVLYSGLICYGTVVKKSDKYIEYTYIGDTRYIGLMARCKYTRLETELRTAATASYEDVSVGDSFVAVISSGEVKDMVVIK